MPIASAIPSLGELRENTGDGSVHPNREAPRMRIGIEVRRNHAAVAFRFGRARGYVFRIGCGPNGRVRPGKGVLVAGYGPAGGLPFEDEDGSLRVPVRRGVAYAAWETGCGTSMTESPENCGPQRSRTAEEWIGVSDGTVGRRLAAGRQIVRARFGNNGQQGVRPDISVDLGIPHILEMTKVSGRWGFVGSYDPNSHVLKSCSEIPGTSAK